MSNRKLDALFEERVLGVRYNDSANPFRVMPEYTLMLGERQVKDSLLSNGVTQSEIDGCERHQEPFFQVIHPREFLVPLGVESVLGESED